jgi:AraC family transcriptional regulator
MGRSHDSHPAERVLQPGRFYGEVLSTQHQCGILLSEARYRGGHQLPKHSHELAFFCLLIDGAYSESYGRRKIDYQPLSIVFHPPDEMHSTKMNRSGGHVFCIEIENHWLERLRECAPMPETTVDLRGGEMVWLAVRLYREYRRMNAGSSLAIEGLLLEMLAATLHTWQVQERCPPAWLARVVELTQAEFQRNLSISEVAAEVGVHPLHLTKVFRQFFHQSLSEYVRNLRVRFACRQLADSEADLSSIAVTAGFFDQSHFTHAFKQVMGITPGSFRKTLQQK